MTGRAWVLENLKPRIMCDADDRSGLISSRLLFCGIGVAISGLEKSLSYEALERWIGQLEHRAVNLSIPKFKLESTYELTKPLQSRGMVRCFEIPQGTGKVTRHYFNAIRRVWAGDVSGTGGDCQEK